ncbi:glycerophosphodiester phosphodiesterase family protein [SAR86 cluster bacterium]|nr:glycerophosphodiester phosphodiesterase family protein [SAR86 cluster bacterium]
MDSIFNTKFQGFIHRGDATNFTENTMEAFKEARANGYKHIETDLRQTKDGKIITFHDPNLSRITGSNSKIQNTKLSEIRMRRLPKKEFIPTIDDLLEEFPDTYFNFDLKVSGMTEKVLTKIKNHRAVDRICLGSFNSNTIREIQSLNSQINTSMGRSQLIGYRFFNKKNNCTAVQMPLNYLGLEVCTKDFVTKCHQDNIKVNVWTINDEQTMRKLIDIGVDGIMSDNAQLLMSIMKEKDLI